MFFSDENTTVSPMMISPASGVSSPARQRSKVVLPQPDGPSNTKNSPDSISSETLFNAIAVPYFLVKLRTEIFDIRTRASSGLFFT